VNRTHPVRLLGAVLVAGGMAGCGLFGTLPSQNNPTCSWTSEPPKDSAAFCQTVFRTLQALTGAELHGDDRTIHRLVTKPAVAARIILFGRQKRHDGLRFLRPSPSVTLGASVNNTTGVHLEVVGQTGSGKVAAPETVYVRLHAGTAYVVDDQPEEEW
jgi:hypothetical protein